MIAFLVLYLVGAALISGLALLVISRGLGVPPLYLAIGFGPKMFEVGAAGTRVRAHLLTTGASLQYVDGEARAERLPDLPRRLALMVVSPAVLVVVALAILGTPAFGQLARGFGQVFLLCWPFGDGGVELVAGFDALLESRGDVVAIGVLSAKLAAFNVMFAALAPALWRGFGVDRVPLWWALVYVFATLALAVGGVLNIVRYLV